MIRTLVVDDDYRVARVHAASVERVPGFTCAGQAHSAAEARATITAARDLQMVRAAMPVGAVYYLVKPFGFHQLREQLLAYRWWRSQATTDGLADQATVDTLYGLLRGSSSSGAARRYLFPTAQKVLDVVQSAPRPVGASQIADQLGPSRPTVQRYLAKLERQGMIELHLEYGTTGRPNHLYRITQNS